MRRLPSFPALQPLSLDVVAAAVAVFEKSLHRGRDVPATGLEVKQGLRRVPAPGHGGELELRGVHGEVTGKRADLEPKTK